MKKIAIFNVGGALSAYVEVEDLKFLVDVGAGNEFSPINDFLLPLAKERAFPKDQLGKYKIDQLFLSHLDNDHISDFPNFNEYFNPQLLTAPNDHNDILEHLKVSRDKVPDTEVTQAILENMRNRTPGRVSTSPNYEEPLAVCDTNNMLLSYIPPKECEQLDAESEHEYAHYANNISLVVYVRIGDSSILFPGDIMKDGMEYLLENNDLLRSAINELGVDFLVTPHHGLDTSFSESFFKEIKNNKVKLNIISEKRVQKDDSDSRHDVDPRYYSPGYSEGYNVLNGKDGLQYGIITSLGHIVIDFDQQTPLVKRCSTNEELINEFL